MTRQGKIIDFRDGKETILNIPAANVIGQSLHNILPTKNLNELSSAIQQVNSSKSIVRIEQKISTQSRKGYYETRLMPVLDEQILVILRDITQKKILEKQSIRNKRRLEIQNKILSDISSNATLLKSDRHYAFKEISEASAIALEIEKVSIWIFNHDYSALLCHDNFSTSTQEHSRGQTILLSNQPNYFDAILKIQATEENHLYSPPGITTDLDNSEKELLSDFVKLNIPIKFQEEYMGIICYEPINTKKPWSADQMHFATSMSDMVSLVYEAYEKQRMQKSVTR